ncbi:polyprenyl synthetase family protein [Puniceicoccales bacterium CK1056]|uniref:Polyprenyl synthetase family protein n=1 Tax=Oceanipulchritudo coccoides TaxID=2706888 RepID=A0A6B2M3F1_9BACT|nr:farnesyl diphosphate synthase [Oceanipulchritudo coccoides]NDV62220.1 polyprenyl synthetase family protein [Oceanipulchritudo coccoides]
MESLDKTYQRYQNQVETGLSALLPKVDVAPGAIHEAMRYCLDAGGKRLRPVLLLAAADLYPQKADPLPAAVAIECLHTYSLVHDDLPSMDNSPLRRGKPSAHVQFDEATAILAGDALLTEAFRLLAFHYEEQPACCVALMKCLSEAADSRHLIGGQVVDTLSENTTISADELNYIHQHKTADLITSALLMGLHLTEAPAEAFELLERAGQSIGLAFQIIDDILDATSTADVLGKTVGNDARQAKNTYVSIHGLEASRKAAQEATMLAIEACHSLPGTKADFLVGVIRKLEHRLN